MLAEVIRHVMWRRRVAAAHRWRDAQRAEYEAAVRRIVDLVPTGHGRTGRPRS
ncbi:hypothetical protein [Actinoplanes sp. NPDC049802]|uniref:hypothetical protein n=1 Tax=Actinoplanes sp. NPDC049802 TaxID=3154742 RepID=UPI0033C19745